MIPLPLLQLLYHRPPATPKKRGPTAGLTEDPAVFLHRHEDIVNCLRAGRSLRQTQEDTGKARNTVLKVKRMLRT